MSKVHEMLLANAPKSMEEKYFSEVNLEFFLSPFKKKKKVEVRSAVITLKR